MKNIIPILAMISAPCLAQQDSIAPYFREFENKISTQVFVLNNSNNFTFVFEDSAGEAEFIPNNKTTLNVGFQYDIVAFSVGFAPGFFADNKDNEGSKMRSVSLDFFPGRWAQRLEYHAQKGMTLTAGDQSLYLENLKSVKIGGSTSFFFNRKFSYRAIALQNVQQIRSAGSFSAGLTYHYTELDGRDQPQFQSRSKFFDLAVTPAYHYNWVIGKHVNLAGGISLGAGINFTNDEGDKTTSALYTSGILLAPGYNSDRWYFGANVRANYADRQVGGGASIGDTMVYSTVFVGYRFDSPEFLTRTKDNIKSKFKNNK